MARNEVSVEVGQKHVRDPAADPVCVLHVLVDVTLRVDHRGDPAPLVSDQVGGVGEAAQVVLLEDHRRPPSRRHLGDTTPQCRTLKLPSCESKLPNINQPK
jgi:hypothetical protein